MEVREVSPLAEGSSEEKTAIIIEGLMNHMSKQQYENDSLTLLVRLLYDVVTNRYEW